MKKHFLILALFITLVTFSGCYTVVWSPDMDFPTAGEQQQEYYYDDYYGGSYYGDYAYFYGYPWWYSITPPSRVVVEEKPERTKGSGSVRGEGGRGTNDRSPQVLPVDRAGVQPDNSNPPVKPESVRTESSDSGSRRSSDDSSRSTRNDDGGRNNNGRRR